jgi:hypothetical protein
MSWRPLRNNRAVLRASPMISIRCYHKSVVAPYAACREEYPLFVYRISANRVNLTRRPVGVNPKFPSSSGQI